MATSGNQNPTNDELREELHKLIAEHESTRPRRRILPEDRYPVYFQNFIYKRPANFYCNLCDENLTLSSIMEHINYPDHMNDVIDARRNQNLSDDSVITSNIRKLLVENNIFRHGSLLKCYSCELIIESLNDVENHIMSLDHKKETNNFETLTYPGTSKNVETISKNDPFSMLTQTPLSDLKDDFFIYFNNFIGKHDDIYVCHVCEVKLLSISATLSHINQKNHERSLATRISGHEVYVETKIDGNRYKLLVENGIFKFGSYFWCNACKSVLDLYITSKNHLHRSSHQQSLKLFVDSCPEETKESPVRKTNQKIIVQKYPNNIDVDSQDDDEKMLTCFICPATQLWRKHKNTEEHKLRKHFYVLHFKDSPGDLVSCLVCEATVHKSSVIDHASKEHQSLPWYRSPDEFIIYFRNFIQPIGRRYFCHLCQVMTSYWYLAMMHIININHSRCVEGSVVEIDSRQPPLTSDFCNEMITNGIFPYNVRQLKCWTCESIINSYQHVQMHIMSDQHGYELQVKQFKINTRFL
ncbi:uncharacterized protein LOC141537909 [Cotesia typhae]|uniref:uncharacterized protein LOC141537909 n=1 Tax=Cotesia typhae TaxID=2053667 RepID=UPI003D6971C4